MHDAGPGAPNPYMPPPMPNTGQQPHVPQNFAPTGRKKALICACNYRCSHMKVFLRTCACASVWHLPPFELQESNGALGYI